jgi:hypothetical protein
MYSGGAWFECQLSWLGLMYVIFACRQIPSSRMRLKCDGTRAETRFRLSAKRTSPYKSAGSSVQSTIGSRGVRIIGSNAGYTMFRGSVKSTGYPLHSPVSPSLPLPCVTVCHHILTGLYLDRVTTASYQVIHNLLFVRYSAIGQSDVKCHKSIF